jgi:hypothetical protein
MTKTHKPKPETQAGSLQRMVRHQHRDQTQNNSQVTDPPDLRKPLWVYRPTAIAGEYANLLLPQLLALLERPEIAEDLISDLAQNNQDRSELQAVRDLWIQLGRPVTGFWLHTYVFCNGNFDDSYIRNATLMPNAPSSATAQTKDKR